VNDAGGQPLRGDPAARVLVAGASGFAGALAAQIVWNHPRLQLVQVSSRSEVGTRLDRLYPRYRVPLELRELDLESIEDTDAAIVAYPHGASAPVVAEARGLGLQVVDLSADFRLRDVPTYEKWYGPHSEPDLLVGAAYGLPELNRDRIRTADLVANPGCYPTAALLALAPLAEQDLISDVVIDAKQGISGAGRGGGDDEMHFVNLSENAMAYKVDAHRHSPEIEQELRELGFSAPVTFVPHLLPIDQGELASCYVTTTREVGEEELDSLYRDRWQDEPFVKLVDSPPGVRDVRDSNDCHLFVTRNGPKVVALAAIDNLWKGAAGQAVQNLNLMLDLPETEGLR
jgi:N-acetyl-gamma-glutamyl-phosphate reductase